MLHAIMFSWAFVSNYQFLRWHYFEYQGWRYLDSHNSENLFYEKGNKSSGYPGRSTILQSYHVAEGNFIPKINNVHLENMTVENSGKYGILIKGREEAIIKNVTLTNVHIKGAKEPLSIEFSEPIIFKNTTINGKEY